MVLAAVLALSGVLRSVFIWHVISHNYSVLFMHRDHWTQRSVRKTQSCEHSAVGNTKAVNIVPWILKSCSSLLIKLFNDKVSGMVVGWLNLRCLCVKFPASVQVSSASIRAISTTISCGWISERSRRRITWVILCECSARVTRALAACVWRVIDASRMRLSYQWRRG